MECKTKLQKVAQAMKFEKGEEFEWIIEDINLLLLKRVKLKNKSLSKEAK